MLSDDVRPPTPDPLTDTVPLMVRVHPSFASWLRDQARKRKRTLGYILHEAAMQQVRMTDPRVPTPVRVPRGPPPK